MPQKSQKNSSFINKIGRLAFNFYDKMQTPEVDGALNEKIAKFIKPIDQFGQLVDKQPLEAAKSLIPNPVAGIKAVIAQADETRRHPNLENFTNLMAAGIGANPSLGAMKFEMGRMGMPVMRDPLTGVQFAPSAMSYFGRDAEEAATHLSKIRGMLSSSMVNEGTFAHNVMPDFGVNMPGARAKLVVPDITQLPNTLNSRAVYARYGVPGNTEANVREALKRIPTERPFNVYTDNNLLEDYGAVGMAEMSPDSPYALITPDKNYVHTAIPHELQHLNDGALRTPLFSVDAQTWGTHNIGGATPTAAMNNFIFESRAELAAERFKHWLGKQGVYHWWDEVGGWPNR